MKLKKGLYYIMTKGFYYSLRPILLFANTDVSTTKMCLDTSILEKSIMGRREYNHWSLLTYITAKDQSLSEKVDNTKR
jgi:hypothetical protein